MRNKCLFPVVIVLMILSVVLCTQTQPVMGAGAGGGRGGGMGGGRGGRGTAAVTQRPDKATRLASIVEIEKQLAALKTAIQKAPANDPCIAQLQGEASTTFATQYSEESDAITQIVTALNSIRPVAGGFGGGRGGMMGGVGLTTEQITELTTLAKEDKATKLTAKLNALAKEAASQAAAAASRGGGGRGIGMGSGQPQQRGPSDEEIRKMEDAMPTTPAVEPSKPRKLLVIDLVGQGAYRHTSIPYWDKTLEIMGEKTGAFSVVVSEDINMFSAENLAQFDAVCLNNSVSLPLSPDKTPELCKSLMDFVKGGKGIMAIHSGTDTFYTGAYIWPEGSEMLGGKFSGHPWTADRGQWAVKIDEPDNPLMEPFKGKGFKLNDEIYRTDPPLYSREKQLVLMSLDMSDEATKRLCQKDTDTDTGISWIKEWGKGRVFYCSLGHVHDVTWTAPILEHYLRGIQYALGDLKCDATPKGSKTK